MNFFFMRFFADPGYYSLYVAVIMFSICAHEYAHARCALWQGDDTAAVAGHLTLNPLKQMGVMSIFMLAIIGIAWGSVPVNRMKMRHRYSDALVSFAGPAMNLALFGVGVILFLIARIGHFDFLESPASLLCVLNFALFILNLTPCYPLDGYYVMHYFFARQMSRISDEFLSGLSFAVIIIVFYCAEYIFRFSIFVTNTIFQSVVSWT